MAMSENLIKAQKKYRKKKAVKEKNAAKQKENFGNIAATFPKAEKELISKVFAAHGLKPSEIIRGAAVALMNGQTIRTEREPLTIPPEYQTAESPASTGATDTDTPPEE